MRINEMIMHLQGKLLMIFKQILSTYSLRKCQEISLENLSVDRVFSHDVTAAILVSQENEMAAMWVSQTNPVGGELFSYSNALFRSN